MKKDYGEALKWYQKAADQGNSDAQFILGFMYSKGDGVKKDYGEALKWCQKAADQGHDGAQAVLKRNSAHFEHIDFQGIEYKRDDIFRD